MSHLYLAYSFLSFSITFVWSSQALILNTIVISEPSTVGASSLAVSPLFAAKRQAIVLHPLHAPGAALSAYIFHCLSSRFQVRQCCHHVAIHFRDGDALSFEVRASA